MLAFLDFEASSLSDDSYPIEVGWVFEDGTGESHLIRPAEGWTDWDPRAEAIHGIARPQLFEFGAGHVEVANRMVEALTGHDLCASAPSWDGKWLSVLLRGAGLSRRALRLRATDEALAEAARAILAPIVSAADLATQVASLMTLDEIERERPAHRALADAHLERQRWLRVKERARGLR